MDEEKKKTKRTSTPRAGSATPPPLELQPYADGEGTGDVIDDLETVPDEGDADDADGDSNEVTTVNRGRLVAHVGGQAANVLSPEEEDKILRQLSATDMQNFYMRNGEEGRAQYQQSLALFDQGKAIVDAGEEILLKKAIHHFRYSVPLKLLQSKLYNAMMFVARPNLMTQDLYSVSLEYLEWIVDFNSNDKKYLRDSLRGLQKTLMEIPADSADNWYSTQIVGEVLIRDGVVHWKLPDFIRKMQAAPERYYYYDMRANAKFKSRYAQKLYELLCENKPFRDQTGHMTLKDFRERMGVGPDEYPEFKRLKQRVIQPALDEISEFGLITATPTFGREKRYITTINFNIERQSKALPSDGRYLDPVRYQELRGDFGLTQRQVTELTETYAVERVETILDVLLYRYVFSDKPPVIKSALQLFKSALKNEDSYQLSNAEKQALATHRERRKTTAQLQEAQRREEESERRRNLALQSSMSQLDVFWDNQSLETRQTLWDAFLGEPESTSYRKAKRPKRGSLPDCTHPMARSSFIAFLTRSGHL